MKGNPKLLQQPLLDRALFKALAGKDVIALDEKVVIPDDLKITSVHDLLRAGANPNAQYNWTLAPGLYPTYPYNTFESSALTLAIRSGSLENVTALVNAGAELNKQDAHLPNIRRHLADYEHAEKAEAISCNPLIYSILHQQNIISHYLISKGCDVNSHSLRRNGKRASEPPLYYAAVKESGHSLLSDLIENGAVVTNALLDSLQRETPDEDYSHHREEGANIIQSLLYYNKGFNALKNSNTKLTEPSAPEAPETDSIKKEGATFATTKQESLNEVEAIPVDEKYREELQQFELTVAEEIPDNYKDKPGHKDAPTIKNYDLTKAAKKGISTLKKSAAVVVRNLTYDFEIERSLNDLLPNELNDFLYRAAKNQSQSSIIKIKGGDKYELTINDLLKLGADPNYIDPKSQTQSSILTNVVRNISNQEYADCQDLIKLLAKGADTNHLNNRGESPLSISLQASGFYKHRTEISMLLLDAGADPRLTDTNSLREANRNLLHSLKSEGDCRKEFGVYRALIRAGADVNNFNYNIGLPASRLELIAWEALINGQTINCVGKPYEKLIKSVEEKFASSIFSDLTPAHPRAPMAEVLNEKIPAAQYRTAKAEAVESKSSEHEKASAPPAEVEIPSAPPLEHEKASPPVKLHKQMTTKQEAKEEVPAKLPVAPSGVIYPSPPNHDVIPTKASNVKEDNKKQEPEIGH